MQADTDGDRQTALLTYQYLRSAMVALLIALAAAVIIQSFEQSFVLPSISAYYYTPAQAIFVGSIIALGIAMIALRGLDDVEDVILNLGGMLAPIVALVPTSRGEDFKAAVKACRTADVSVLTDRAPTKFDCPTAISLTAATRANVENNITAFLIAGGLGLLVVSAFALVGPKGSPVDFDNVASKAKWGLTLAAVVYLAVLVGFVVDIDWFIDNAHYAAATGLFVAIVGVVVANARRRDPAKTPSVIQMAQREGRWYFYLAVTMVAAFVVLSVLVYTDVISLFVLEAVLIGLFAAFWVGQTVERWDPDSVRRGQ